jgi:hypothetical protein
MTVHLALEIRANLFLSLRCADWCVNRLEAEGAAIVNTGIRFPAVDPSVFIAFAGNFSQEYCVRLKEPLIKSMF